MLKRVRVAIFILIALAFGLFLRLNDIPIWQKHRSLFYYNDRPLFTSYDAFFFARYAKDYRDGIYKAGDVDPLRMVPDNFLSKKAVYPDPIPMESWLGAELSKLFHTHVENVAMWFTPITAVLFVIPFILFFEELELPLAGIAGALFGVGSFMYLARTCIVRFDTDSLNFFFPFVMAFLLIKFIEERGSKRRFIYAAAAGIFGIFFNWWYAHPSLLVVMFLVFIAALFAERLSFKDENGNFKIKLDLDKEDLIGAAIFLLFMNPLTILSGLRDLSYRASIYIFHLGSSAIKGRFPNILQSVSEAQHVNLKELILFTTSNPFIFYVGLLGAFLFFILKWRRSFLILPLFLIGLMSFKGGNRFSIYLSLFLGAGFGFILDLGIRYLGDKLGEIRKELYNGVLGLAVFGLAVYSLKPSFKFVAEPKITRQLEGDFIKLDSLTPKGSWIWTWWDYGTAIEYLSARGTYHDGQSGQTIWRSAKSYFVAFSYSTANSTQAYNDIVGISKIGVTGIVKLLKKGVPSQQIRDMIVSGKFNGKVKHPVFWVFTGDEVPKFMWINYFGTWNFQLERGAKKNIYMLGACQLASGKFICQAGAIDLKTGTLLLPVPGTSSLRGFPIKRLALFAKDKNGKVRRLISDINPQGVTNAEIVLGSEGKLYGFCMGDQIFNSMFNRMFILRDFDQKHFKLVYDNFPDMVVYYVNGTGQ